MVLPALIACDYRPRSEWILFVESAMARAVDDDKDVMRIFRRRSRG